MPKFVKEFNGDNISASESASLNNLKARRIRPNIDSSNGNASFAATTTLTAQDVATGYINTTAVCSLTFPSAASIIAYMNLKPGDTFDLIVDGEANAAATTMVASATVVANATSLTLVVAADNIGFFTFAVNKAGDGIRFSRVG